MRSDNLNYNSSNLIFGLHQSFFTIDQKDDNGPLMEIETFA